MFDIEGTTTRHVKRWRNEGDMRRRWAAAGVLEAEKKFRRVRGYKQIPQLVTMPNRHAEKVNADTATPPCDTEPNELAA